MTLIYFNFIFIQIIEFFKITCAFSSCYSQVCCLVSKCSEICLLSFCYLSLVRLPCDKRTNTLCMISIILNDWGWFHGKWYVIYWAHGYLKRMFILLLCRVFHNCCLEPLDRWCWVFLYSCNARFLVMVSKVPEALITFFSLFFLYYLGQSLLFCLHVCWCISFSLFTLHLN